MPTLYENYTTGDDYNLDYTEDHWGAQSFTPSIPHSIYSVKLLLHRNIGGTPGTVTASIRATDVDGLPTGADLCSGTTNGDTLAEGSPYEWRQIVFSSTYLLLASVKYAIVVRCSSVLSPLWWRTDGSSPTYTGGAMAESSDAGTTWSDYSNYDNMFEEWGGLFIPKIFYF